MERNASKFTTQTEKQGRKKGRSPSTRHTFFPRASFFLWRRGFLLLFQPWRSPDLITMTSLEFDVGELHF